MTDPALAKVDLYVAMSWKVIRTFYNEKRQVSLKKLQKRRGHDIMNRLRRKEFSTMSPPKGDNQLQYCMYTT